jgi:hypothetical protein
MIVPVELWAFREGEVREVDIKLTKEHWDTEPVEAVLEEVFYWGQNDHQEKEQPSVSVGDIAVLNGKRYICQAAGWKEIEDKQYREYTSLSRQDRLFTFGWEGVV